MTDERALLAGGCVWGVQDLIRQHDGVRSTRIGYTGGSVSHATYRNHASHAEAVEIIFDPARVSYRQILEFFFQIHDSSTRDRQGNDVGTSYRSAIFYTSQEQKRIAAETIADVDASGAWPGKVVTELVPAALFWEADAVNCDDVPVLRAWTQCAVCAIEVPLDAAVVPEPTDRLMYLCGLDCYARWRAAAAVSFPSLSPKRD